MLHRALAKAPSDRAVFCAIAISYVFVALASLNSSSFFLNWDTSITHVGALDVFKGCWGNDADRPVIMWTLAGAFFLFGSNPLLETVMTTLLVSVGLGCLYLIARAALLSRTQSIVVAVWFMSWSTTFYYARTHLGYPLGLYLMGLALYVYERYFTAGILMGLTALTHANMLLPIAVLVIVSMSLQRLAPWRSALKFLLGLIGLLLITELVRYVYTGEVFGWWIGTYRLMTVNSGGGQTYSWWHVPVLLSLVMGLPVALLLLVGNIGLLISPFYRRNRLLQTVCVAGVGLFGFFTLRTAMGEGIVLPRLMNGAYPLLAMSAVAGLGYWTQRLVPNWLRKLTWPALIVGLLLNLSSETINAARYSTTAYPSIENLFRQAHRQGIPVRVVGTSWPYVFYGVKYNVETMTNLSDEEFPLSSGSSIIIIESNSEKELDIIWTHLGPQAAARYQHTVWPMPWLANRLRGLENQAADIAGLKASLSLDMASPVVGVWVPLEIQRLPGPIFWKFWSPYYYPGDGDCYITDRSVYYSYRYYRFLFPRVWRLLTSGR